MTLHSSMFNRQSSHKDGLKSECKECSNKLAAAYREHSSGVVANSQQKYNKRRETSKSVFIRLHYKHMLQSVRGQQTNRPNMQGRDICTREEFLDFSLNDLMFNSLYATWQQAGCPTYTVVPSIDRINNSGSYTLDNIQWLTYIQNVKKG